MKSRPPIRGRKRSVDATRSRPWMEPLEDRCLLSFADGNGPVVVSLSEAQMHGRSAIVIGFDGPLNAAQAQNVANYRVNALAPGNIETVTTSGPADPVLSAAYNDAAHAVTLTLARPLRLGQCYRVFVNGTPGSGITDPAGTLIDGDNDDTPGGNFYGLIARGPNLTFTDLNGDRANVRLYGGGTLELWRQINGDVAALTVVNPVPGRSALTGWVKPAPGSPGQVVIPSLQGTAGVRNLLPPSFVSQAAPINSPAPVVATPATLPYTLQIDVVPMPLVPALQSNVAAQSGNYWLVFGGRTNGLHGFNPSGTQNFPPLSQNNTIYVIDSTTGQVWSEDWSATGLPISVTASLSSSNQEFYQRGDRLYTVGGYSYDATTSTFTTFDTLSAISVSGLINAVMQHGNVAGQIKQISDPRLTVTGGGMNAIGNRTYLVFGQDFQGGYNGGGSDGSQVYTNEIRSFRIIDKGNILAIRDYSAQRDPVNFRRRDYNLAPAILPGGSQALNGLGGVFTPNGNGYRNPITIGHNGVARVNPNYQQYFSQYTSALIPLFDPRTNTMATVLLGGIGLYHYDFATGTLSSDTQLPFVNDVTTLVQYASGGTQEFIMPSQFPTLLGAEASFFAAPGLPTYPNGVINLAQLHGPTTLGYMYGGIYSTSPNTTDPGTQTTASALVFRITLVPV